MKIFFSPEYVASSVNFDTTRKAQWIRDSLLGNPIEGVEISNPQLVPISSILAIHDRGYVKSVQDGTPRHLAESSGFPWNQNVWKMVLASTSGQIAAVKAALSEGVAGSLSSGCHHARREQGKGFCTFNGLAIAAHELSRLGRSNVLILDLDAHCGGGTHSIVQSMPWVTHVDVSVSPGGALGAVFDSYTPSHQNGNVLVLVNNAEEYIPTIVRNLELLNDLPFDFCLYNAGMDPYEKCHIGGLRGITRAILEERERIVFDYFSKRNIPISFIPAGGYINENFAQCELVDLHRLTLEAAKRAYS